MNTLLLDRVTYYVEALDPAKGEGRTLEKLVHDYTTDDEARQVARLNIGSWEEGVRPNAVASHTWDGRGVGPSHIHRPLLDVDGEVTDTTLELIGQAITRWTEVEVRREEVLVVPSSTLGHHHVYVQVDVPEVGYMHALMHLAALGVIEPNYALVSIRRRASFLRLPGVQKITRPVFHEEGVPW